jgi:hypothetical protein
MTKGRKIAVWVVIGVAGGILLYYLSHKQVVAAVTGSGTAPTSSATGLLY